MARAARPAQWVRGLREHVLQRIHSLWCRVAVKDEPARPAGRCGSITPREGRERPAPAWRCRCTSDRGHRCPSPRGRAPRGMRPRPAPLPARRAPSSSDTEKRRRKRSKHGPASRSAGNSATDFQSPDRVLPRRHEPSVPSSLFRVSPNIVPAVGRRASSERSSGIYHQAGEALPFRH